MSDIDTAVADSLKMLDLKRPIREADLNDRCRHLAVESGPEDAAPLWLAITAPYLFSLAEIMASVLLGGPLVTSS